METTQVIENDTRDSSGDGARGELSTDSNGLPTPLDRPHADVVIYDGKCVFCIGQVRNLLWFDGGQRLAFVSLHDRFVSENFPDLTHDQMMEQLYIVPRSDKGFGAARYGGAAAIRYLTRRLPRLWIFAPIMHLPFTLPIWQWGYRQVAKRRYKISGKRDTGPECDENGTCDLHFKE